MFLLSSSLIPRLIGLVNGDKWNEIAREYSLAFYDSEASPSNPKWHGNRLKLIIN